MGNQLLFIHSMFITFGRILGVIGVITIKYKLQILCIQCRNFHVISIKITISLSGSYKCIYLFAYIEIWNERRRKNGNNLHKIYEDSESKKNMWCSQHMNNDAANMYLHSIIIIICTQLSCVRTFSKKIELSSAYLQDN